MTTKGRRRLEMRTVPLRPLRVVQLPSIADELDRVDPFTANLGIHQRFSPRAAVVPLTSKEDDEMETIRSSERVQLLKAGGGRGSKSGHTNSIRVPRDLVDLLPDVDYVAELTDEGILFKPAALVHANRQLPAWAKNGHK